MSENTIFIRMKNDQDYQDKVITLSMIHNLELDEVDNDIFVATDEVQRIYKFYHSLIDNNIRKIYVKSGE